MRFQPRRMAFAALALTVAVGAGSRAQAGVSIVYDATNALSSESGRLLEGRRIENAPTLGWVVPVVFPKQIVTQPPPARVTMIWTALPSAPGGIPDVFVDGQMKGPAQKLEKNVFMATVDLPRFRLADATHSVQLNLTIGSTAYQSNGKTVILHPVSPFILLERTFRHDRCTNCHSLQSSEAIHSFHEGFGVELPDDPHVAPQDKTICMTCHETSFTGVENWKSPAAEKAPNFRKIEGSRALCDAVIMAATKHLTNDPPFDFLSNHFRLDDRIKWALENGHVPLGLPPLQTAPPYDLDRISELADWWVMWGRFGKFCDGLD